MTMTVTFVEGVTSNLYTVGSLAYCRTFHRKGLILLPFVKTSKQYWTQQIFIKLQQALTQRTAKFVNPISTGPF